MTSVIIKQKLQQYINNGDDKLIKMMYALAKEYNEDDDFEYEFTDDEMKVFDERRRKRLNNESKTFTWQEAKKMIKKNTDD